MLLPIRQCTRRAIRKSLVILRRVPIACERGSVRSEVRPPRRGVDRLIGCAGPFGAVIRQKLRPRRLAVDFGANTLHDPGMLELLVLIARALALVGRGHHELLLETLALRADADDEADG
jgi:hypothetical protein